MRKWSTQTQIMMAREVSHTPYAPDPATVEFFLLLKWKTTFKGRLQDDTEYIRKKVTTQSNAFLLKSSDECFGKLL
jgi:hypothetical protein